MWRPMVTHQLLDQCRMESMVLAMESAMTMKKRIQPQNINTQVAMSGDSKCHQKYFRNHPLLRFSERKKQKEKEESPPASSSYYKRAMDSTSSYSSSYNNHRVTESPSSSSSNITQVSSGVNNFPDLIWNFFQRAYGGKSSYGANGDDETSSSKFGANNYSSNSRYSSHVSKLILYLEK